MNPEMTPAQREAFRTWCWDATDADAAAFHDAMRSYLEPLERAIQATQSKPAPDLLSASDPVYSGMKDRSDAWERVYQRIIDTGLNDHLNHYGTGLNIALAVVDLAASTIRNAAASDPGDEHSPEPTIPVPRALAREWVECESTFRRRWPDEHPRARLYDALKAALDRRDAK